MAEEKKVATKKAASTKAPATKKAPAKKTAAKAEVAEVEKVNEATSEVKAAPAQAKAKKAPAKAKEVSRLQTKYKDVVVKMLMEKYGYKSVMEVPKLEKIVINIGVGDATVNTKLLEDSVNELTMIAGQKPVITKAKKSIASFKLREGQAIGCKVTLRGLKMYYFLDKLVSISLPRVRDFRGVSKTAFDGRGNYTLGIKEQSIFPEIVYDKINKTRGMDIVVVTTAKTDKEAYDLLQGLGMPFHK